MSEAPTDRNLLFAALALQMDFVGRDALGAALNASARDKAKALSMILCERGALTEPHRDLLEMLVAEHLARHGGNPATSLAALRAAGSTWMDLEQLANAEAPADAMQATLSTRLPAEAGDRDGDHGTPGEIQATLPTRLPAAGEAEPQPTKVPSAGASTSAGLRFRILRQHARGGLGEVFVARDTELERDVALKEIQGRHAHHPESRSRFVLEAQVTGALEHPGIVPVYGLGHYPDGRPFYAMRFIRGDSLKDAVERFHQAERPGRDPGERTLALRELLRRFVDVCNAIAYAHSRGVLHRDLKPANVMLGEYGETLVVDWGLAKLQGTADATAVESTLPPVSGSGSTATAMGQVVGTPSYMSPEQAAGLSDQIGPASDVYSLGGTLYSLLTGKPPAQGPHVGAILESVRRGEFPRPRQVSTAVPPALEAICLKAMALRPGDRYATPRALADDVEHWLADEPVAAYPEPWRTRLGRWARRNRSLVAAAAALLLTATAGLAVGLVAVGREQQQTELRRREAVAARDDADRNAAAEKQARDEADRNAAAAEEARGRAAASARTAQEQTRLALETLKSVVFDIQREMRDSPGLHPLREKLLKTALDGLKKVSRDAQASAADADRNTSAALNDIGDIFLANGRTEEARQHFQLSFAIAERLAKADPGSAQAQRDLSVSYEKVGDVSLQMGDAAAARAAYQKGLEVREKLATAEPASAQAQRDLLIAYNNLADVSLRMGDAAGAKAFSRKFLEVSERLAKAEPASPQAQRDLSVAYTKLGDVSLEGGDAAGARAAYLKAQEVRGRLVKADPAGTQAWRDLSVSYERLGDASWQLGDAAEAKAAYQKGLEVNERLAKADPASAQAQRDLSVSFSKLGDVNLQLGDVATARAYYQKDLEVSERLAKADPASANAQRDLSVSFSKLGNVSLQLGDSAGAKAAYLRALEVRERLAKAAPADVQAQRDLFVIYTKLGNAEQEALEYETAARWFERGLALLRQLEKEGKLKGQPEYGRWIMLVERSHSFCKAVPRAVEDEAFALAQPKDLMFELLDARVRTLVRRGNTAAAAKSAEKWYELAAGDPFKLYGAARRLAVCAMAVDPTKAKARRERYAARAVAVLTEAVERGYKNTAQLKTDRDLDGLRERDDFKKVLAELEANTRSGNPKKEPR